MNILIAEDELVSRLLLEATLKQEGFAFTSVSNGQQAWEALQRNTFSVLITDYRMPEVDGFELTRRLRAAGQAHYTYVILLTAAEGKTHHLEAIEAGVDDFITKPFEAELLYTRLHVAKRIADLRQHVKRLEGLLPICANCKKIRDGKDAWKQLETYITQHSEARFSFDFCPECAPQFLK